jgi:adenylate cyclase
MRMDLLQIKPPSERAIRITTGLVMFSYVTCHLVSHATGLFLLNTLQSVGHDIILAPWRTPVGLLLLSASFLTHLGLGLTALYRRRHLRMPAIEAWQLGLALTIPLLLAPHVVDARLGVLLYGLEDSYFRVLYLFWITDPALSLSRQLALLIVVWSHGCIGLHMWLRYRPWYRRRVWWFAGAALALPLLAILGIVNAGWDTVLRAAVENGFSAAHGPPAPGSPHAAAGAALALLVTRLQLGYVALVIGVFGLRAVRNAYERRSGGIDIDYRAGRRIRVPRGFTILEASRWAAIPHASVCGGRGRCSTCRVRVWRGLEELAPPAPAERMVLQRLHATSGIRLACQVRPTSDIAISPILPAARPLYGLRFDLNDGRELPVTALNIDLRDSVKLAAGRLPFDTLFILDRYIQAATAGILAHGGFITSVAGDGIMAVFGFDSDAATGARQALASAEAMWRAIDAVSAELADEIGSPLRFGIGVHSGPAIVGALGPPDRLSLQFLGDTGNVAARLQALTKEMKCTMIVAQQTTAFAGLPTPDWRPAEMQIRGIDDAISAFLIEQCEQLTAAQAGGAPTLGKAHDDGAAPAVISR